jgi:hypothetical protein
MFLPYLHLGYNHIPEAAPMKILLLLLALSGPADLQPIEAAVRGLHLRDKYQSRLCRAG